MENILTDGYCLSPYTCKCCTVLKQFKGLNFDGLAGKCQKGQNFPRSKFSFIRYNGARDLYVNMEQQIQPLNFKSKLSLLPSLDKPAYYK